MFISDDGVDVYIQCIQRKAVFGKRKFTGCFTAINFDSCRSRRDPLLPNDIFMGNVGLLITKLTYTVTWAPAAARPMLSLDSRYSGDRNGLVIGPRSLKRVELQGPIDAPRASPLFKSLLRLTLFPAGCSHASLGGARVDV